MIAFLLIIVVALLFIIAAVLLFGRTSVRGAAGTLFAVIFAIVAVGSLAVFFGVSAENFPIFFLGFLGFMLILHWILPLVPNEAPKWIRFTRIQRKFLANIDEYHRIKDELHALENEFVSERAKGATADQAVLSKLDARIRILEGNLARFSE